MLCNQYTQFFVFFCRELYQELLFGFTLWFWCLSVWRCINDFLYDPSFLSLWNRLTIRLSISEFTIVPLFYSVSICFYNRAEFSASSGVGGTNKQDWVLSPQGTFQSFPLLCAIAQNDTEWMIVGDGEMSVRETTKGAQEWWYLPFI